MAKKKSGMTIDFDTAWKEALACYFFLFMRFFFPKTAEQLDETVDYEVLNTTLSQSAWQKPGPQSSGMGSWRHSGSCGLV